MQDYILIIISLVSFILSFFGFKTYKKYSIKKNFLDKPNAMSMHKSAIPTGAGIIIIITLFLIYLLINILFYYKIIDINFPNRDYLIIISICSLGLISFIDDIKQVHPLYRLLFHLIFAMISVPLFSYELLNFELIIPEKITFIIIIFLWVYLINIFNFLDGSNGYLSLNTIFALLSYCLVNFYNNNLNFDFLFILSLLSILIIYLYFNFPTAKIFMGDSGSIVIGYVVGYVFFDLCFNGFWYIAFAIISYPIFDVSLTILQKSLNGKYPWERLFDYFFLNALKSTNNNHNKIFYISFLYNILNFIVILSMIIFKIKYLLTISIFLGLLKIYYYKKMTLGRT